MRLHRKAQSIIIAFTLICVYSFGINTCADEYYDYGTDYTDTDNYSDDTGYTYDDWSDDDWDYGYTDENESESDDSNDDYQDDNDEDDNDEDESDEESEDESDEEETEEEEPDEPISYEYSQSRYYAYNNDNAADEYYTLKYNKTAAENLRDHVSTKDFSAVVFREMSIGMYGDDVLLLQEMLIAAGYLDGTSDGSFGPGTQAAVMTFQSDNNITADGYAGLNTLQKLFSALSKTDDTKGKGKILELDTKDIGKRFIYIENYKGDWRSKMKLFLCIHSIKGSLASNYSRYIYTVDTGKVYKSSEISSAVEYSIDVGSSFVSLLAALDSGKTTVDLGWNEKIYQYNNWDYDGPTYGYSTFIAVSINDQHLWYFSDGGLFLDTPVVTGLTTKKRHTPLGIYQIINHATEVTLTGSMAGESWESFVNYWMAISGDGVGLHDSSWRGSSPLNYGGYVYTYDGSHGCINIPYDAAEKLYYGTYDGIPVIIY